MKMIFCGDIVPTERSSEFFDKCDTAALMGDTIDIIKGADAAVFNLECALTDNGAPIRKCGPNLKGRPEHAAVLAKCGFTHAGLSNNHVFDFGLRGLDDTEKALEDAGIVHFGIGDNDADSRKAQYIGDVAVVAVCEHEYSYALPDRKGANPFDPFDTMEDITEAKQHARYVVVMYHGGKEQCEYPSPRLRKACHAMARAGADLILCQHSHCIGCRENYRGTEIVYGQGNFHFRWHDESAQWHTGLMAEVEFGESLTVSYHPVTANGGGIRLALVKEKEEILAGFADRSEILQDDALWMAEWEKFCRQPGMEYYRNAVRNAYIDVPEGEECRQVFPHYLDCEAHMDVWKTIYRTWHADGTSGC